MQERGGPGWPNICGVPGGELAFFNDQGFQAGIRSVDASDGKGHAHRASLGKHHDITMVIVAMV